MNKELGLHLSQNASEHVYLQTPEEGLVNLFRTHMEKNETYREVDDMEGVTGAPRKWADLLSQDYVWNMMEYLEPLGIHMFDGRGDMKLHKFHQTMLGTSGGVREPIYYSWLLRTTDMRRTDTCMDDRTDGGVYETVFQQC